MNLTDKKTNERNEEILELERHIRILFPVVKRQYEAINSESTFAERFAAEINKSTIEHKIIKLNKLKRGVDDETNK